MTITYRDPTAKCDRKGRGLIARLLKNRTRKGSTVASLLLFNIGCAHLNTPKTSTSAAPPTSATVDLYRSAEGAKKIYVQAQLHDGSTGLFLLDTGAAITAITQELADRLQITGTDTGRSIQGLGGRAPLIRGELPALGFGGLNTGPIHVAIGVPGIPKTAGWMPIDGILGNNVWGQFVLNIDYPADRLTLTLPTKENIPANAQNMFFDGQHVVVETYLKSKNSNSEPGNKLLLELDTGARGILLSGRAGAGFENIATEGEEPIFGVGASEDVPISAFYRRTRHIAFDQVTLGGATVDTPIIAKWINYGSGAHVGPQDLNGLIGHAVLEKHNLYLNYQERKFALTPSSAKPRQLNGHSLLLNQDIRRYRNKKARGLYRAKMYLGIEDYDAAEHSLKRYLRHKKNDPEALSLLARIKRLNGDVDGYLRTIQQLSPKELAVEGEIISAVNTLLIGNKADAALALALAAKEHAPEEASSHIAFFEVQLGLGDLVSARTALRTAIRIKQNPNAFLMHRSRLSLLEADTFGTTALLRLRLALYPSDGFALWAYALSMPPENNGKATFSFDMTTAMNRLHPDMFPLDFAAAVHLLLGNRDKSLNLMKEGIARDCEDATPAPEKENCEAWYKAMANQDLDAALELVDSALKVDPHRPDFLDTKAVVHLRRGELELAKESAQEAVRLSPADVYHLWQLDRIRTLEHTDRTSK